MTIRSDHHGAFEPVVRLAVVLVVAVLGLCTSRATAGEPSDGVEAPYNIHRNVLYVDETGATPYMLERCRLDVSYPGDEEGFPTVVWFHAGGLTGGERSIPERLHKQGIAVVAPNYRLSPSVQSPAYVEDAAAAVAWCVNNIESYGGDPAKVFVAGHSAGGYLTSIIGFDKSWLAAHEIDADALAGLIPLSGHTITHFTVRAERGIPGTRVVVDEMAPMYHVRPDAPPTLLVTGDRELEMLGRYEENAFFWRMLRVAGDEDVELIELEGFDHGTMVGPGLDLVLGFVKRHSEME